MERRRGQTTLQFGRTQYRSNIPSQLKSAADSRTVQFFFSADKRVANSRDKNSNTLESQDPKNKTFQELP